MRRRWVVVAVALPLAVIAGGVATVVLRGNRTTPVSVDDAVAAYRAEAASTSAPVTTLASSTVPATLAAAAPAVAASPEPGVYVYATTGYETVDALTGTRRDYPAETAVTIRADGCGVTARWDVARERWDAWTTCPVPGGTAATAYTAYHEFFGIGTTRQFVCAGDPRPVAATVASTWTVQCLEGNGDTSTQHGTVLGLEDTAVGGAPVEVQHVRLDVVSAGSSVGDQVVERWVVPTTGLVVRERVVTATTNQTQVGKVHFREEYEIVLTSLTPRL